MASLAFSGKVKRGAGNPLATTNSSSGSDDDLTSKVYPGESTCLPQLVHPDCTNHRVEQLSCTVDFTRKGHHRKELKSCKNPKPKKQKADNQYQGSKIEEDVFKVPINPVAVNWFEEARQLKPKNRFLAKLVTNRSETQATMIAPYPDLTSKPMRERSLPRSFWQQPNKPLDTSKSLFHILPPINAGDRLNHNPKKKRTIRVSNIELLQKLFDAVDSPYETRHLPMEQKNIGRRNSRCKEAATQLNFEESPPLKMTNQYGNPLSHEALIGGSKDPYLVDPVANRVLQKMSFCQSYSNLAPLQRHQGAPDGLIYPENLGVRSKWVEGHSKALQEQQRQMSKNTQMLSELVMHI